MGWLFTTSLKEAYVVIHYYRIVGDALIAIIVAKMDQNIENLSKLKYKVHVS